MPWHLTADVAEFDAAAGPFLTVRAAENRAAENRAAENTVLLTVAAFFAAARFAAGRAAVSASATASSSRFIRLITPAMSSREATTG